MNSMQHTLLVLALHAIGAHGHAFMTSPPSRQLVNDVAIDPKTSGPDGYSTVLYGGKRDGYAWRLADEDLASLNAQLGGGDAAKAKAQGHGLCGDDGPRGASSLDSIPRSITSSRLPSVADVSQAPRPAFANLLRCLNQVPNCLAL